MSSSAAASPIAISPSPSLSGTSAAASSPPAALLLAPRATPPKLAKPDTPVAPGGIVMHKEWVVPPRPKPGRKPATDTPPTKRKAQNRAAQRAFRERRVARVNELEDKLKEVAAETSARDADLLDQIAALTRNNTELARENTALKRALDDSRREVVLLQLQQQQQQQQNQQEQRGGGGGGGGGAGSGFVAQVASPAPSADSSAAGETGADDVGAAGAGGERGGCERGQDCACAAAATADKFSDEPVLLPLVTVSLRRWRRNKPTTTTPDESVLGCGSCTSDGACACYAAATSVPLPKRPTSPKSASSSAKRSRPNHPPHVSTASYIDALALETDFTGAYSKASTPMPPDPCGFCSDGTPCVCAEVANSMDMSSSDMEDGGGGGGVMTPAEEEDNGEEEDDNEVESEEDMKLAPILRSPRRDLEGCSLPQPLHPAFNAAPAPAAVPVSKGGVRGNGGGGGCRPGNCAQCRNDPMSTLFCQSVAARQAVCADIEAAAAVTAAAAGRSKRKSAGRKKAAAAGTAGEEAKTYIPCSAAYQTLSRHHGFRSEDLGKLVRPLVIQGVEGRCPQVEVSSVRDVLKQLDRRFGTDV